MREGRAGLVVVPRAGEGAATLCERCGARRPAGTPRCPACRTPGGRLVAPGVRATARELQRSLPPGSVDVSEGATPLGRARAGTVVVATPGSEPAVDGGYGCVLLLDAAAQVERPRLSAPVVALHRWVRAAALAGQGATVHLVADPELPGAAVLHSWDTAGWAVDELRRRVEAGLPPARRLAVLRGPAPAVAALLDAASLPEGADVLDLPDDEGGPDAPTDEVEPGEAALFTTEGDGRRAGAVLVDAADGTALADALGAAARVGGRAAAQVRVRLDEDAL